MAYVVNSAKDSQGDEGQFLALFTANQAKIVAYKQAHGGALEDAFQAVTGKPWPAGRSVKVKNGKAVMTKDRTVKSVLGKYVLPIAAGVAAPFALPALMGGGAGAAAAGTGVGIGETGATVGLAGAGTGGLAAAAVPAVASAAPSLWSKIAGPVVATGIQAGTELLGTKMQVDANKQASETAAKAAEDALAWEKEVYKTRQGQLGPAIGVGNAATSRLGDLMGLQVQEPAAAPAAPATKPATTTPPASTSVAPPAGSQGLVKMRAPTGEMALVPAAQVSHYQAQGAVVV